MSEQTQEFSSQVFRDFAISVKEANEGMGALVQENKRAIEEHAVKAEEASERQEKQIRTVTDVVQEIRDFQLTETAKVSTTLNHVQKSMKEMTQQIGGISRTVSEHEARLNYGEKDIDLLQEEMKHHDHSTKVDLTVRLPWYYNDKVQVIIAGMIFFIVVGLMISIGIDFSKGPDLH